jgi:hypothetical protein
MYHFLSKTANSPTKERKKEKKLERKEGTKENV